MAAIWLRLKTGISYLVSPIGPIGIGSTETHPTKDQPWPGHGNETMSYYDPDLHGQRMEVNIPSGVIKRGTKWRFIAGKVIYKCFFFFATFDYRWVHTIQNHKMGMKDYFGSHILMHFLDLIRQEMGETL